MGMTRDEQARALFRAMPTALLVLDHDLMIVDANDAYVELVGRALPEMRGRYVYEVFPPGPSDVDDQGVPLTRSSIERERAHQARELTAALRAEELASRRVSSLADLALALTTAATVDELPRIVTGGLAVLGADGSGLTLPGPNGGWRFVAGPGLADGAQTALAALAYDSRVPTAVAARTGQPLLLLSRAAGLAFDAEAARDLYDVTGCEAWAHLPLRGADEGLGALSVAWTGARSLSVEELALLDGFAAQVAQAIQRLTATAAQEALTLRAQRLSETLQRSLLTTPLEHEHLDIAVRYLPAAEEAQIGGDWYDAFATRAGRTLLVVGDVSGHDRTAAAMMGQVRNLLRGLAFDSDDGPAALLSRLDAALLGLDLETLATCVLVSVEAVDGTCRIRWSNAGHLEPLLRLPDGTVVPLGGEQDLLLGLDPETARHEGTIALDVDSVLVLCTDGLVERRTATLDEGLDRLAAAVASGPARDPEGLCEHVLAALDDGRSEDDVVLLVARTR